MSLLSSLLPPANVLIDVAVDDKAALFERVGELLEQTTGLKRSLIVDSLLARERMGSTALGHGIAIPHGRVRGLREAVGAFVRLDQPIAFDAPDEQPVRLIFVLLVPERSTDMHLEILSELAEMFSSRELRAQLTDAADALAVHRLVVRWDARGTQ